MKIPSFSNVIKNDYPSRTKKVTFSWGRKGCHYLGCHYCADPE